MQLEVIIAAGGTGSRMGLGESKQLHSLAGRPVLAHTIAIFDPLDIVSGIIVAIDPDDAGRLRSEVLDEYGFTRVREVVAGGAHRAGSVANALAALAPETDTVLVHDGARPLFTAELLREGLRDFLEGSYDGVVFGLPVADTIKELGSASLLVARTPDREHLWQAQTPQIFRRAAIEKAYHAPAEVLARATDDSSLVERAGGWVKMVRGSRENIKLTEPADLVMAEAILRSRSARVEE